MEKKVLDKKNIDPPVVNTETNKDAQEIERNDRSDKNQTRDKKLINDFTNNNESLVTIDEMTVGQRTLVNSDLHQDVQDSTDTGEEYYGGSGYNTDDDDGDDGASYDGDYYDGGNIP